MAERRLVDSTLYREDAFVLGHTAVWGSFWEPTSTCGGVGRWGYACCQVLERSLPCTNAAVSAIIDNAAWVKCNVGLDGAAITKEDDRGSQIATPALQEPHASDLQLWADFEGPASAFVGHVVRWLLCEWRLRLAQSDPALVTDELFCKTGEIGKAEDALNPLLRLLQRVETRCRRAKLAGLGSAPKVMTERDDWDCPHCTYRNHGERTTCRKCKKDDDTYAEPTEFPRCEELIFEKVERIASLAAGRDYTAASEVFLELTIGTARWQTDILSVTCGGQAPSRKARAAQGHMRRQADAMAPMDTDEGRLYLLWLKRLVNLSQVLRPSPELAMSMTEHPSQVFGDGSRVVIKSLESRPDLGGTLATVLSYDRPSGRYAVSIEKTMEKLRIRHSSIGPSIECA